MDAVTRAIGHSAHADSIRAPTVWRVRHALGFPLADSNYSVLSPTSAADKSASAQMASQRQPIAGARWFASYYCEYLLPVLK